MSVEMFVSSFAKNIFNHEIIKNIHWYRLAWIACPPAVLVIILFRNCQLAGGFS